MANSKDLQKALDDLWERYGNTLSMLDDALNQLEKKPKEVIVEVEKVIEKEVPVEVEKITEKIVEKPVEVEKIVEVEKVVEKIVKVRDEKVIDSLHKKIRELEELLQQKPKEVVKEIEKEVPVEIEKAATGDLKEAARLLAGSEFNKEDNSEKEIYNMLQKLSEDEVKRKIGFWAMPLPTDEDESNVVNKRYQGKVK